MAQARSAEKDFAKILQDRMARSGRNFSKIYRDSGIVWLGAILTPGLARAKVGHGSSAADNQDGRQGTECPGLRDPRRSRGGGACPDAGAKGE